MKPSESAAVPYFLSIIRYGQSAADIIRELVETTGLPEAEVTYLVHAWCRGANMTTLQLAQNIADCVGAL